MSHKWERETRPAQPYFIQPAQGGVLFAAAALVIVMALIRFLRRHRQPGLAASRIISPERDASPRASVMLFPASAEIVCATLSGDTPIPSTAVWVQRKMGMTCPAFDVNAACAVRCTRPG